MYTITHNQGYDMPVDVELLESYEGEARAIILESFIDEGMISSTVYAIDEVEGEDIELIVSEWLSADEIHVLKDIEQNADESFFDGLTVDTLDEVLKMPTERKEAA